MDFSYKADLIYDVMVAERRPDPKHTPCERCSGTGAYITGSLNGKPTGPGGICYRCAGKGFITERDSRRNYGYDNFYQRVNIGFDSPEADDARIESETDAMDDCTYTNPCLMCPRCMEADTSGY